MSERFQLRFLRELGRYKSDLRTPRSAERWAVYQEALGIYETFELHAHAWWYLWNVAFDIAEDRKRTAMQAGRGA